MKYTVVRVVSQKKEQTERGDLAIKTFRQAYMELRQVAPVGNLIITLVVQPPEK